MYKKIFMPFLDKKANFHVSNNKLNLSNLIQYGRLEFHFELHFISVISHEDIYILALYITYIHYEFFTSFTRLSNRRAKSSVWYPFDFTFWMHDNILLTFRHNLALWKTWVILSADQISSMLVTTKVPNFLPLSDCNRSKVYNSSNTKPYKTHKATTVQWEALVAQKIKATGMIIGEFEPSFCTLSSD